MNSSVLLREWAVAVLEESGVVCSDSDMVECLLTTTVEGCCEMCRSESAVIEISVNRVVRTSVHYL